MGSRSPDIEGFSSHIFIYLYRYLQMVPDLLHDPVSILICKAEFMALFDVYQAENH